MEPASSEGRCGACGGKSYLRERQGERAVARLCDCSKDCPRCEGRGYVYQQRQGTFSERVGSRTYEVVAPCSCRPRRIRTELFSLAQIPAVLSCADFDNFIPQNREQNNAKEIAAAFAHGYSREREPKGFVVSGPVGTGKSHLLAAVLGYLTLELGVEARYVEISLLYATIRRGFQEGRSGGEIIGPLSSVQVLAIDELGKGRGSPFELETLDELIARRYNNNRTTLFATNYSLEPERKAVQPYYRTSEELKGAAKDAELLRERVSERIYSRLCQMCDLVELPQHTKDYRYAKHERSWQPIARGRLAPR